MSDPKISIIVPVYNVEQYLRRCLESIRAQTFADFECICVDDGSPDGSGGILDEYAEKDSRFVVIHKENGGVSSARNAGLDAAKGEWIAFCDSDDWVESCMLEKMLSGKDAECSEMIVCGAKDTLNLNTFLMKYCDKDMDGNNALSALFPSVWAKLYRRKYIIENNLFFPENIRLGEDVFFTYSYMANVHKILCISGNYYNYFVSNEDSACHNVSEDIIFEFEEIVRKLEIYILEKNRTQDFWKSLVNLKLNVKNRFLFSIKKANFEKWRNTFPEINSYILKNEKSFKFKIFYSSILNGYDFIAGLILKVHNVYSKIRNRK